MTLEKELHWKDAFEMIENCLGIPKRLMKKLLGGWARQALVQGLRNAQDSRLAVVSVAFVVNGGVRYGVC